jgi:CubicO group peptidase (beta-lactamase class C family)
MRALACTLGLLVVAGCAVDNSAQGAEPNPPTAAAIDRIAGRYLADMPIAGLTVTVARDGRIVHDAAYGYARRSPNVPVGATVPFELFALTEPVTAVLLLRLAERGLLDLDAPAGKVVRGLQGPYSTATLRQLLRHSSGNADIAIDHHSPESRHVRTPGRDELATWLAGGASVAAADEQWMHSGAGYVIAGLAAEAVTNMPLAALLRDEMARPIGLAHFGWCPDLAASRAQGYMTAGGVTQPAPRIDYGWLGGAGAVCATTGDLARWWLAVRGGRLISPASLQEWLAPLTLERNGVRADFGQGLGIRLGAYGGHTLLGQTGDGAGGSAVIAEYPDDRLLIVVATNTAGPAIPHAIEIQAAIARELLGITEAGAPDVTIEPESLATVPGLYRSPEGTFCVQAVEDRLVLSTDEEQAVDLLHLGNGRFIRADAPEGLEYFLGWPDHVEWFAYAWFGVPMDLAAKQADSCDGEDPA